ncbi:50S ribosomal protein L11 methyltransferase [Yunchengibacter salinarum]|uniref:50S ribosomal protein L11 methyltransferase n=1 Tax=Yunchengibacter salinarum TaxID=3133399 RepID=UPI0035B64E1F
MSETETVWCATGTLPPAQAEALEAVVDTVAERFNAPPPTISAFDPLSATEDDSTGEDWRVDLFFTGTPAAGYLDALLAAAGAEGRPFELAPVPDRDWVSESQKLLHPVSAGRFFIYGAHDADKRPDDTINLHIEAGQAFGTGRHETTCGCLELLDRMAERGESPGRILDVGTGSGVLSLAAHKLWRDARILASDIDPTAVNVAQANIDQNRCASRPAGSTAGGIATLAADGLTGPAFAEDGPYDLIMANILARPLVMLAPAIADALARGGQVMLSGLLVTQEKKVLAAYGARGLKPVDRIIRGDWLAVLLKEA